MIRRRRAAIGFGAFAAVAAMASVASACSPLNGTMTVSGNGTVGRDSSGAGGGSSVVVGDASTSMGYCSAVPGATAKRIGGTVTVTVVATTGTCANGASLTPGRAYTVYYRDGSVWRDPNGPDPWSRNNGTCMTGTSRVAIGSGTANAGGGWTTATYNLPSSGVTLNASNTDASVCVESDGAFNEGNEAPVQIVSV